MARVPLIQEQDHPEFAEMIEKFRAGRRGKLINIYRMLLNAPPLAESWFNHSNTVRWKTTLSGRLREIVIIRMGHLTKSQYVLRQHVPSLALADEVFAQLKRHFDARQIVELTVLVGTYNMNARVLTALELDLEPLVP